MFAKYCAHIKRYHTIVLSNNFATCFLVFKFVSHCCTHKLKQDREEWMLALTNL